MRLHKGNAWLRCPHCRATFARDEDRTRRMRGESMGCPHCGMISTIGEAET